MNPMLFKLKNAEFELEKKKEQLKDTQVTAPISGTVVRVNAKVGRLQTPLKMTDLCLLLKI